MAEERESNNVNPFANVNPQDLTASSTSVHSGSTMANLLQLPHSAQPSPMQYPVAPQVPHGHLQQISNDMHHESTVERSESSHQVDHEFMQLQNLLDLTATSSVASSSTTRNFLQPPNYSAQPNPMQYQPAPQMPQLQQISDAIPQENSHGLDQFMQLQNRHMELFWQHQMLELENPEVYRQHHLPLSRIRRIMKVEGEAQMVSAETPMMFAKACEYFIQELAIRSWLHAERSKRQTIKRNDVAAAVCSSEMMDFLIDIVPPEDMQDHLPMRQHQIRQQNVAPHIPHEQMQDHMTMGQHQVQQQNMATQVPHEVMQDHRAMRRQQQVEQQNMATHTPNEVTQDYMGMGQQQQVQQQNMGTHGHTFNPRP